MKNFKILITGVSATGKSSICKELQKRGYFAFDPDDENLNIAHWVNRETGEIVKLKFDENWIKENKFVWNNNELIKLLENSPKPVFVCGVVDKQYKNIDIFDKVFLLQTSPEEVGKRLINRDTNDFGKKDFEREGVLKWQEKFDEEMLSVGAIKINSLDTVEKTVDVIISKLRI